MELKIDQEFKDLIPPLSVEEVLNLEQSLLTEGCRDALVTWQGYLIDGHNRYAICTKHNVPFTTKEMEFDSRADVEIWMIRNQKGRRNVSTYVMVGLGLKLEELLKQKGLDNKSVGATLGNISRSAKEVDNFVNSDKQISAKPTLDSSKELNKTNTRKEIANFANTSHDTVAKVKEIKNSAPIEVKDELERKINSSEISINQAHKFIRAIKGIKNCGEVARKAIEEFNKNPNIPLENKARDIIREKEREERDRILKENEERKRLEAEAWKKQREEAERLEIERIKAERLEKERLEKERLENERLAREKALQERKEQERLAQEKYKKEKAEKERLRK